MSDFRTRKYLLELDRQKTERIADLERQLSEILNNAEEVVATAQNTAAVRKGHAVSGYIKYYKVPRHIIVKARQEVDDA